MSRQNDPTPGTWSWYVKAAQQRADERYAGELTGKAREELRRQREEAQHD